MTREQAIKFSESGWWEGRTACEITALQLYEPRLCLPEFQIFHEAVESALEPDAPHPRDKPLDGKRGAGLTM